MANFQKRKQLVRQCAARAHDNCLYLPWFIPGWKEIVDIENSKRQAQDRIIIATWKYKGKYWVHIIGTTTAKDFSKRQDAYVYIQGHNWRN